LEFFFVFVLGENNKALETKKNVLFSCKCAKFFVPQAPWQPSWVWHCNQIEKDLKSFFNFLFVFVVLRDFFSYLEFLGIFLPSSITKINVYFFKKSSM